jgi:hypothetical protein
MNQPNCLFCGKPADHKCGDAYDCGACCSMRGLLAHDSPLVYKWLENRIRPELLHLRSALTQPPRQSVVSDEIPYRGPFVFSAFGSGVALAQPAKKRDSRYPLGHYNNPMPSDDLDRKGGRDE